MMYFLLSFLYNLEHGNMKLANDYGDITNFNISEFGKKYKNGKIVFFYCILMCTIFSKLLSLDIKLDRSLLYYLKHRLIWLTFLLQSLFNNKYHALITSFYNLLSNDIYLVWNSLCYRIIWCDDQVFYIYFMAYVKILSSISFWTLFCAAYIKFKISKLDVTYYIFYKRIVFYYYKNGDNTIDRS